MQKHSLYLIHVVPKVDAGKFQSDVMVDFTSDVREFQYLSFGVSLKSDHLKAYDIHYLAGKDKTIPGRSSGFSHCT